MKGTANRGDLLRGPIPTTPTQRNDGQQPRQHVICAFRPRPHNVHRCGDDQPVPISAWQLEMLQPSVSPAGGSSMHPNDHRSGDPDFVGSHSFDEGVKSRPESLVWPKLVLVQRLRERLCAVMGGVAKLL